MRTSKPISPSKQIQPEERPRFTHAPSQQSPQRIERLPRFFQRPLEEAALDPFRYIEVVYNRTRICSALGYLGPAEFEKADWSAEDTRPKAAKRVAMASG